MTTHMDNYANPTTDGVLIWRSASSCVSYTKEGLEHWKHYLHQVWTKRCDLINFALRWIIKKVRDMPNFEGLIEVSSFFNEFELQIPKQQRLLALYVALRETLVRWWETHREGI
jgi:hypothetical protein